VISSSFPSPFLGQQGFILSHHGNKPVTVIRLDIKISKASTQIPFPACRHASFMILSWMTKRPPCISLVHLWTKWFTRIGYLNFAKLILQSTAYFVIKGKITKFSSQKQEKYGFVFLPKQIIKEFQNVGQKKRYLSI
jgi:hypothetical protein